MGESIIKRPASRRLASVGLAFSLTIGIVGYLSQKDMMVKTGGLGLAVSTIAWALGKRPLPPPPPPPLPPPHLALPLKSGATIGRYQVGQQITRLSGENYQVFTASDTQYPTKTFVLYCYQFPSQQQDLFNQYRQQAHTIQKGMQESLLLQVEPIHNVIALGAADNHKSYSSQVSKDFLIVACQAVAGQTLAEVYDGTYDLAAGSTVPTAKVTYIIQQILQIVGQSHQQGTYHTNISPETVVIRNRDRKLILKGFPLHGTISRTLDAPAQGSQTLSAELPHDLATLLQAWEFQALEVSEGKADARSDLYSIGLLFLFLTTGFSPYSLEIGADNQIDLSGLEPGGAESVTLHPEYLAWLKRAISIDPSQRFQTAKEMQEAFEAVVGSAQEPEPERLPKLLPGSKSLVSEQEALEVITTDLERDAYRLLKQLAQCCGYDPADLAMTDQPDYCDIHRKKFPDQVIVRLFFNQEDNLRFAVGADGDKVEIETLLQMFLQKAAIVARLKAVDCQSSDSIQKPAAETLINAIQDLISTKIASRFKVLTAEFASSTYGDLRVSGQFQELDTANNYCFNYSLELDLPQSLTYQVNLTATHTAQTEQENQALHGSYSTPWLKKHFLNFHQARQFFKQSYPKHPVKATSWDTLAEKATAVAKDSSPTEVEQVYYQATQATVLPPKPDQVPEPVIIAPITPIDQIKVIQPHPKPARTSKLEDTREFGLKELNDLANALNQLSSHSPQDWQAAQSFKTMVQQFMTPEPQERLKSRSATDADQPQDNWIRNIVSLGYRSDEGNDRRKANHRAGTDFEKITQKAWETLGFQSDPQHKGGAGGLDLYFTQPYPLFVECKSGQKIPTLTVAQLINLGGKHLGGQHFLDNSKLIIGPGTPSKDVIKSASEQGWNISIMNPETLALLVQVGTVYEGAIDLWELKKQLVAGVTNDTVLSFLRRVIRQIQERQHLIDCIQKQQIAIEKQDKYRKGVSLEGIYQLQVQSLNLSRDQVRDYLIELSSPLTGYLTRKDGENGEYQFFFRRSLEIPAELLQELGS